MGIKLNFINGCIVLIAGIAGNLIAGWIQNDILHNIFNVPRLAITLAAGILMLFISAVIAGRVSSKESPQSNTVNNISIPQSTLNPVPEREVIQDDSDYMLFQEIDKFVNQTKLEDMNQFLEDGKLPIKYLDMVKKCRVFARQADKTYLSPILRTSFNSFIESLAELETDLQRFRRLENDPPDVLFLEPEKYRKFLPKEGNEWSMERDRIMNLASQVVDKYRNYRLEIKSQFPFAGQPSRGRNSRRYY